MQHPMYSVIVFASLIACFGPVCHADDDARYPGYHFEPKVIYRAPELQKELENASVQAQQDEKYPGAYFTPYVIYRAPDLDSYRAPEPEEKETENNQSAAPAQGTDALPTRRIETASPTVKPLTAAPVATAAPGGFPILPLVLVLAALGAVIWAWRAESGEIPGAANTDPEGVDQAEDSTSDDEETNDTPSEEEAEADPVGENADAPATERSQA